MTVYRCNQCGTVAENTQSHNSTTLCAKCQSTVKVYDTVFYIQWLLKQYFAVSAELKSLKENNQTLSAELKSLKENNQMLNEIDQAIENKTAPKSNPPQENNSASTEKQPQLPNDIVKKIKSLFAEQPKIKLNSLPAEIKKVVPNFEYTQYGFKKKFSDFIRQCDFLEIKGDKNNMMVSLKKAKTDVPNKQPEKKPTQPEINLNDTDLFANQETVEKIKQYLTAKNLTVTFDYDALDMSGYFDESSEVIGENFALISKYLKTIRYLYNHDQLNLSINCKDLSKNEVQKLQNIFKQLYDYTIFARYVYNYESKKIHITLNSAESVEKFLCGGWLEWFAAIKLIKEIYGKGKKFAIARSVVVAHEDGDKNEFDVVFMSEEQTPIFIECKSGEFRQDLDKFIRICKKINIPTKNWLVIASEIDEKQANAFEKMYPVSFSSLEHFVEKVKPMI